MSLTINDAVIVLIFGAIGFIMAFFLMRALSAALLGLLTFAAFKAFEAFGGHIDWRQFSELLDAVSHVASSTISMTKPLLESAGTFSILFFLFGGLAGLVVKNRG